MVSPQWEGGREGQMGPKMGGREWGGNREGWGVEEGGSGGDRQAVGEREERRGKMATNHYANYTLRNMG